MRLYNDQDCNPNLLSPLTLAFVGDAVYGLLVRERLVLSAERSANDLHRLSVDLVRAGAQHNAVLKIIDCLTEKEAEIYKRGRNAHANHLPKNADPAEYHAATGLETLFGYLYLDGQNERIRELFNIICE
ncbi:MAG: ribonuclease III [Clostridia bacterium]|nr:ribonuclease III [Clostridia bacterium]